MDVLIMLEPTITAVIYAEPTVEASMVVRQAEGNDG